MPRHRIIIVDTVVKLCIGFVAHFPLAMQLSVKQWATVCSAVSFGGRSHSLNYALAGSYELDWALDLPAGSSEQLISAGSCLTAHFQFLPPFFDLCDSTLFLDYMSYSPPLLGSGVVQYSCGYVVFSRLPNLQCHGQS